ncbi:hypothetical protein ACMGDM_19585 [Sphingomonas sp. DT-51]|uniref:hypothetical protein n=1 Tax=Sphingomonas sp. DT-51 TaxID=3396165 RepID=UPI003F1C5873
MAYMHFGELQAGVATSPENLEAAAPALSLARFSALEWSVIALAQRDDRGSLGEPSAISQAMATLFGERRSNRLADERLEALRRVSVLSWTSSRPLPQAEVETFLSSGYSAQQYDLLVDSISKGRVH